MNYIKFAKIYDNLIYDVDYKKMADFYKDIIEQKANRPFKNILELGCGTGNITEKLIGYNIIAVDYSEEMLSIARSKLGNRRNVRFINGDIRNLNLNKKFDLVIAGLDIINYITSIDDLNKVFKNVYGHLEKDGIFIFDINSKYKIESFIGDNVFTDEIDNILYIWQGAYNKDTKTNDYLLTFFVEDKDGKYNRFSETHSERAYSIEEITSLLNKNNFNQTQIFNNFNMEEINEESMRITFVVSKEIYNER